MSETTIHQTEGHFFHIEPEKQATWTPYCDKPLKISVIRTHDGFLIRGNSEEGLVVETTIQNGVTFEQPSKKFCQLQAEGNPVVYGIGFDSETLQQQFVGVLDRIASQFETSDDIASLRNRTISTNSHTSEVQNEGLIVSDTQYPETQDLSFLSHENERLRNALSTTKTNAEKWKGQVEHLQNLNARLSSAFQDAAKNVDNWRLLLDQLKDERDDYKLKYEELSKENESLDHQLKTVLDKSKDESQVSASVLKDKEDELKIAKEEIVSLKTRCSALEQSFTDAQQDMKNSEKRSDSFNAMHTRLLEWHTQLATKIADLDDLHAALGDVLQLE